jgi:hypothetical protein
MPEVTEKHKSKLRIAAEKVASDRLLCNPVLKITEMEDMSTQDILQYIGNHIIEKKEPNEKEKPVQADLYETPEPTEHKKFTSTVREKISKASSIKDLLDIHTEYPLLRDNLDFLRVLRLKKEEINTKLNNLQAHNSKQNQNIT